MRTSSDTEDAAKWGEGDGRTLSVPETLQDYTQSHTKENAINDQKPTVFYCKSCMNLTSCITGS
jgi:hypothetical protein